MKLAPEGEQPQKKKAIFMDMLIENSDNNQLLSDTEILEEVSTFIFAVSLKKIGRFLR